MHKYRTNIHSRCVVSANNGFFPGNGIQLNEISFSKLVCESLFVWNEWEALEMHSFFYECQESFEHAL